MTDLRQTMYLPGEGRVHMKQCITQAFARCRELSVKRLVLFTGTGEGVLYALQEMLPQPDYSEIEIVAVTPPIGRRYKLDPRDPSSPIVEAGIASEVRNFLVEAGVVVISAHMPFKALGDPESPTSGMTMAGEVLSILGGGFPLCIQSALVACDAGAVSVGERVVVASADTAIVLLTTRTETFLSKNVGLLVEEFICRPAVFDISKREHAYVGMMSGSVSAEQLQLQLPSPEASANIADDGDVDGVKEE